MSNWKKQAKDLIAKAEIIEAIGVIEANGIKTGNCLSIAQDLEAETQKDVKNKTLYAPGEYQKHRREFYDLTWKLLQLIDGTNKPMPEYLKF